MGQKIETTRVSMSYGYTQDGQHVLVQYSVAVDNNRMTIPEAEAMVRCLNDAIEKAKQQQLTKREPANG